MTTRRRPRPIFRKRAVLAGLVAACAAAGTVAVAEPVQKWKVAGVLEMAPSEVIGPVSFAPGTEWAAGGEYIAASVWDGGTGYAARIWSAESGLRLADLEDAFPSLVELSFTPRIDEVSSLSHLVYAHTEREVRAWRISDGGLATRFALDDSVRTNDVVFVKDHFLNGREVGGIGVWSRGGTLVTVDEADALRPYDGFTVVGGGLVFMESGSYTVKMNLRDYDPAQVPEGDSFAHFGPYEAFLDVSASGRLLASYPVIGEDTASFLRAVKEPTVRIWGDLLNWGSEVDPRLEITGFDSAVATAAFSRDETRLLTREEDGDVAVWDTSDGVALARIPSKPGDRIVSAWMTPQGDVIVGLASGVARLFDIGTGGFTQEFPWPSSEIAFSPDGKTLITYGIGDAPARFWRWRAP